MVLKYLYSYIKTKGRHVFLELRGGKFMFTLIDLVLTICTGGLWLIVVLLRNAGSAHRRNKAETKYYNRSWWWK
jgi:thiamine pyrophosphate-dependent acetolactate synthase large subunit-like protein